MVDDQDLCTVSSSRTPPVFRLECQIQVEAADESMCSDTHRADGGVAGRKRNDGQSQVGRRTRDSGSMAE